jgi:hypothetical protein
MSEATLMFLVELGTVGLGLLIFLFAIGRRTEQHDKDEIRD